MFFTTFDLSYVNDNIMGSFYWLISEVTTPCLMNTRDWGELNRTTQGLEEKHEFLSDYDAFVRYMERMNTYIN